ncbi:MAG: hypothetical protein K9H16_08540 [Bacteroidales bacterium]|nr:hypothetical protein [Bacteroidales bacterium]
MEMQAKDSTIIKFNKKYLKLIATYLKNNKYNFTVDEKENGSKTQILIQNLKPDDAFYLGVKAQVQLMEGESLI